MQIYYVGVDGGGTKTSLTLIDQKGTIVKNLQGDGSNIHTVGINKSCEIVSSLITQSVQGLGTFKLYGCLAVAGINFEDDVQSFNKTLLSNPQIATYFGQPPMVVNDTLAALRAGSTNPNSIVIISGTGSNCYGVNQRGDRVHKGGLDYILGDEGSGYWMGMESLKNIARHLDGRQKPTILTNLLFSHFQISSLEQLYNLVYQSPWSKKDISFLAQFVDKAYASEDVVAQTIAHEAILDLITLVKTIYSQLYTSNEDVTLVKSGGVLLKCSHISQVFDSQLKLLIPNISIVTPTLPASQAAAMIALEHWQKSALS